MIAISNLQAATKAAKEALGLPGLGVQVAKGKAQIVNVTYDAKGKSKVIALTEWFPVGETVSRLKQMTAEAAK